MTSHHTWLPPRPPALEIPPKDSQLTVPSSDGLSPGGALSPDIQPNTYPVFPSQDPSDNALSLLKIGNYLLTEQLADLSCGIAVYKAMHIETQETLTCRVVPNERCRAALLALSAIGSHPNINSGDEVMIGATSAYVMHRTSTSEDLHAYVRRMRRLTELEAAQLFWQALESVAHCHRHGVIVRDVKLRRFHFADQQRKVLQLDGLYDAVLFSGSNDQLTDKHGCLAYVSPEILDATFTGTNISSSPESTPSGTSALPASYSGRAADMWSLGVMLYTMLIGRYPFVNPNACALFACIRSGRYVLPAEVSLSTHARCLIRSLLAVDPSDRLTVEEALRHPWFTSVQVDNATSAAPVGCRNVDDGVVPQVWFEPADEIFIE